ncbi:MAG: N-methyl-L-tryptophan oxidase [Algoriphagus sp.]|uniref:N-methyl-L-tryptophan oxidase n=1 Tax=Algoriphagus sp. TaxID=1872435 RepID=UPI002638E9BD|nr:N-methyl-L-tryptophan oxidase [Algoriphagus sp.]MDG1275984.1 N-methyl-L-tryptophan oxidase [Algoriphagus sp.]
MKYDLAVIGLGAVGSAALYQLSKRGVSVLGIDQFDPPHQYGSSHGETRITRLAVGEGRDYVALAMRSHQIWEEIFAKSGKQIYHPTGGILLDSGVHAWGKHGTKSFLDQTISYARDFNIKHELADSKTIKARFPQFLVEKTSKAYLEKSAGYLLPELAIATQLELAKENGAKILPNTKVKSIQKSPNGISLDLEEGKIEVGKVILSAGGWIKDFLPKEVSDNFKICRQVLHWLELEKEAGQWKDSPVFMWGYGSQPEDFLYGFPSLDGETVKMASESFVDSEHPDLLNRTVTEEEQRDFWENKVKGRVLGFSGKFRKSEVCFYTVTQDARFKVDFLEGFDNVLMASACSGHGFKHSAALGEHLVQKLFGEDLTVSLEC